MLRDADGMQNPKKRLRETPFPFPFSFPMVSRTFWTLFLPHLSLPFLFPFLFPFSPKFHHLWLRRAPSLAWVKHSKKDRVKTAEMQLAERSKRGGSTRFCREVISHYRNNMCVYADKKNIKKQMRGLFHRRMLNAERPSKDAGSVNRRKKLGRRDG